MEKSKSNSIGKAVPGDKTQVNFSISNATLEKVKDLAFWETTTQAEIYNRSVVRFLELWEEKNGEIKPRPPRKGLDTV